MGKPHIFVQLSPSNSEAYVCSVCNLARALADDEHKKIGAKLYIYSYIVGTEQLLKGVKTIGYWGTTHFECSGFLDNQDDDEDYED